MVHIVIDTCVWIDLLKAPLTDKKNLFDEFMYWFDTGELKSVTCDNLIREWDRTQKKELKNIIHEHKIANKALYHYQALSSTTVDEQIENAIDDRIVKIDFILKQNSVIAAHDDSIYIDAGKRSIGKKAPCHDKDSFRDAVNVITIIRHLRNQPVEPIYFTTINYKDFTVPGGDKHALHPDLAVDFAAVKLVYEYFQERDNAGRLMNVVLRRQLPDFEKFLAEQQGLNENLSETTINETFAPIGIDESEYIRHLSLIDMLTAKSSPSALELRLLEMIVDSHPSYKQYFLRKLSEK